MRIQFHTNLDEAQRDVGRLNSDEFVQSMPAPRKGERIRFTFDDIKNYDLEVVGVVYDLQAKRPAVLIELHMPSYYSSMSIADWTTWFNRHRFGRV